MNNLQIEFEKILPDIANSFSNVYGDEYESLIEQKFKRTIIIPYNDLEGTEDYIRFLKRCKERELSYRFLEKIGIDIKAYKKESYAEKFDTELINILENFIDSLFGFSKNSDYWSPLLAFKKGNKTEPKILLKRKLKLINYLLGESEVINEDNYKDFTKTNKYKELLEIINRYILIYKELLLEYKTWEKELLPYKNYAKRERKRKKTILQNKKDTLFKDIYDYLPEYIKSFIADKPFKEQEKIVLGEHDISIDSPIEYFLTEQIEKLESPDTDIWDKRTIIRFQREFLKGIGISCPEPKEKLVTEEDINEFLTFLKQDDIREKLPTEEHINLISKTRKERYEQALKLYHITRSDFKKAMKGFSDTKENRDAIYYRIKDKSVCILSYGGRDDHGNFISIMFYTTRTGDGGVLLHNLIHECGHVIDQNEKGNGFETIESHEDVYEKNPYNKTSRKYEKFNETINDIFTGEAENYLYGSNLYLIEPKELTIYDTGDYNTAKLTKELLQPLIKRFRKQVIKAKVNSNPQLLIEYIGLENYENLVDAVNKVDYLSRNGLASKLEYDKENPIVAEYYEQVERVRQIYINIDEYANNLGLLSPDESPIKGTSK